MRIMIVDDDEIALKCLEHALQPAGHEIVWARDGDEAWGLLRKDPCRMVISDWVMPGMDGLTLCRKIRELKLPQYTYIMLITSNANDVDVVECLSAGADDILTKPFNPAELRVRILSAERILKREAQDAVNRMLRSATAVLEKKNKRLEELYRLAHTFVDNVSHEFRTPLTVIADYVDLVLDGTVGEISADQRDFLEVIASRADDLHTMVDDMLDSSKLDAGMLSVVRRECRVANIIERVRASLERKAASRDVRMHVEIEEGLPAVYVDDEKVGRVLINLAVNAIKFSGEQGEVLIRAAAGPVDDVLISVTDNGPGIEPELQQEIFERFRQLKAVGHSRCKGFGLGLGIARELVDLNLGELSLDSEPGRGTTFSFTLPPARANVVLERFLDRVEHLRNGGTTVTLVSAGVSESTSVREANDVDAFLAGLMRHDDLLIRAGERRWIIATPVAEVELENMLDRLEQSRVEANRNRPGRLLPAMELLVSETRRLSQGRTETVREFEQQFDPGCYCLSVT